jgi:AcrR family transcriptional regulator
MTRRSLQQTRQMLIDIGIELLHERGTGTGVTHIRVSDVVERAGVTTGAAYRCWDDQEAFHRDLAIAAVQWRASPPVDGTVAAIRHVVESGAPWQEMIRVGSHANLHDIPGDTGFLATIALRATASEDPALTDACRRRYDSSTAAHCELYANLLKVYGRKMKSPYTLEHLTVVLAALSEGFCLRATSGKAHPDVEIVDPPDGVGTQWTLLALSSVAIVEQMTEPCPGDADADRVPASMP